MDWLTHNFIGDMYGPNFLAFYFVVILATIVICKSAIGQATRGEPERAGRERLVPTDPDPYEIAYLRGGVNEVIRLAIYELLHAQLILEMGSQKKLGLYPGKQGGKQLTPIQRTVLEAFRSTKYAHEVFHTGTVDEVAVLCAGYDDNLRKEGLLVSPELASKARNFRYMGIAVILLLGGYKLTAALANGHTNVGFLIALAVVGSMIYLGVTARIPRLTFVGESYLMRMQAAFGSLRSRDSDRLSDRELALLVGLFGLTALAGSSEAAYAGMFRQSASASGCNTYIASSGCGTVSSCGSSPSSCSSGGSSCSSGGGGGCGGCGGGG